MADALDLANFILRPKPAFLGLAACRGLDPNIFFPPRGDRAAILKAKEICDNCCVQLSCQEYFTFQSHEREGIFGGLSPRQRERRRAKKRATECLPRCDDPIIKARCRYWKCPLDRERE